MPNEVASLVRGFGFGIIGVDAPDDVGVAGRYLKA